MGKRTSDFMALAAILGGAGLGLGLTGLLEQSAADHVRNADYSPARVRVLRRSMMMEPGPRIADRSGEADVVRHALIVGMERRQVGETPEVTGPRYRTLARVGPSGFDRAGLERLLAQVEGLRREAEELRELDVPLEASDLEALYEALDAVEALQDLDLGQKLTIDILRSDDDERRRRRRGRRPRRASEGPGSAPPGN